jgi:hypothetical protein
VVAVSQAPSPESNPDSPLPVTAMVGLDPTIEADKAETRGGYLRTEVLARLAFRVAVITV